MKARFLKAARDELAEAVRFDNAQKPGLRADFRDELKAAVERVKAFPEAWQLSMPSIDVAEYSDSITG